MQQDLDDLRQRVAELESATHLHLGELDLDDDTAHKLALLKPRSTSIKSLLFTVIDYVNLMPVYDQGRKPGFQLAPKPMPKKEESGNE